MPLKALSKWGRRDEWGERMMGEGVRLLQVQGRKRSGLGPKQKGSWEPVEVKAKRYQAQPGGKREKRTFSSVQFSCSVVSDSLRPHEPQHARSPCPSPTPRVCPNPCPSGQWCHPTISSSVVPFSSWPQSFPASGSFPMSQVFASGGQSIGVSASTSVLPINTQEGER